MTKSNTPSHAKRDLRIAIIGAGASGLMALIKLRQAGHHNIVVFEKADSLGGTWRDNRYPGLCCDVPSLAYRFSFAPNPNWAYTYAPGAEILAYLQAVADQYGVAPFIQYGHEVIGAQFQPGQRGGQWAIETSQGPQGRFDAVLTAAGVLHHPVYPDIDGLDDFAGVCFHSSRWPENLSLGGKRVAVIGTGSTATQLVTAIVSQVAHLSLFQRTAQWILPVPNPPIAEEQKAQYRAEPTLLDDAFDRINDELCNKFAAAIVGNNPHTYATIVRNCEQHLQSKVREPDLRRKLTPNYKVGCKRLVVSDGFYDAIQQPNAALVVETIERIEANGIRTIDGRLHELDVLVLATGFNTHQFFRPMNVTGENGISLEQAWAQKNEAYLSVTVPHFPNWFMIGGPNSPIGNFSWMLTAECQLGYAMKLIDLLHAKSVRQIAPTVGATMAFNDAIMKKIPDTIWATGCRSWYIDKTGNVASWPWSYEKFRTDLSGPNLAHFEIDYGAH